jgi:type II secretory pathway component PulC
MLNITPVEIVFLVIIASFIFFPIPMPSQIFPFVNTNLGLAVLVLLALYLLLNTTPLIGIFSVFAIYIFMTRCSSGSNIMNTPSRTLTTSENVKKTNVMKKMNVNQNKKTLEEEMVDIMAPVGQSPTPEEFIDTSFKPVNSNIKASMF